MLKLIINLKNRNTDTDISTPHQITILCRLIYKRDKRNGETKLSRSAVQSCEILLVEVFNGICKTLLFGNASVHGRRCKVPSDSQVYLAR